MSAKSELVADLIYQMQRARIYGGWDYDPGWKLEYRFCPKRKWSFDFAYPSLKLAIEVQGGTYAGGRHSRGASQIFEYEKLNAAAQLGWRILYFDARMIKKPAKFRAPAKTAMEARRRELYGCAVETIRRAMGIGTDPFVAMNEYNEKCRKWSGQP